MYNLYDTITAIATPAGESALAIVRLSGAQAKSIGEKLFKGGALENRHAAFGKIANALGQTIDEVVAIYYQAPKSFTGEDMIEIICHGGYVIPQQIVSLTCELGARPAGAGEFTLRAFVNGKVDLTEAEAIDSIIRARTEKAKDLGIRNLEGKLRKRLEGIQSKLFNLLTIYEAQIDFADDEIKKLSKIAVLNRLSEIYNAIVGLLETYDIGRMAEGRAHVAIIGAPNVGKSTLFNALLEADRAIVTEIPGTTRDYLSEYVNIGGYPVIMTDTAGLRESSEIIEAEGMKRTEELIAEADLCLFVIDASRPPNKEDDRIAKLLDNRKYILIVNKIDIANSLPNIDRSPYSGISFPVSAAKSMGLKELQEEIYNQIIKQPQNTDNGVLLSQRQNESAKRAQTYCMEAIDQVKSEEPEEIVAGTIRECLNSVAEMVGKITNDDILNQIFSRFCIGK